MTRAICCQRSTKQGAFLRYLLTWLPLCVCVCVFVRFRERNKPSVIQHCRLVPPGSSSFVLNSSSSPEKVGFINISIPQRVRNRLQHIVYKGDIVSVIFNFTDKISLTL